MKTALVTAIGSFSADIVIKNLKNNGIRVIGCDIYPAEWIADAKSTDSFYQVPYATQELAYVSQMLFICEKETVDAMIVLTDVEADVWNRHREELKAHFITLCLSGEETMLLCRDKRKMSSFLLERGLGNPIETVNLLDADIETIPYPAVVKPYNGRSSQGLHYVSSIEEMKSFLTFCEAKEYVVQPFYKGSIITVDVVRQETTGECGVICRRELLRTGNGAGTSVLVFSNSNLEAMCKEIAEALNINGCVNFEFIEGEDGIYRMLECNPRFSGGVEFSCLAGYDCITNHIRCFTGEKIEPFQGITSMYVARKYEEYITKIVEKEGE
jgi:carbamoyl-phosphate synthase large subunit